MSYAPFPAEFADASWQGATAYTPLTAEAADSSWRAVPPSGGGGATPYDPLPAGYADASWLGATAYTRLTAEAADSSWWVAQPGGGGAKPYAPLSAEFADASWRGATPYAPLPAEAANASWWEPSGGATPYVPLPALYADASWQGAAPYTPLAAASADASWRVAPAAGELVTKARGFLALNFGTAYKAGPPATQVGVASGGASTLFGLAKITHAARGLLSTDFGAVRSQIVFSGPGESPVPTVGTASGIQSVQLGTHTFTGALVVQAAGEGFARFGAPTLSQRFGATGAALALLGTPALRLAAHARGFSAAYMGTAHTHLTANARGSSFVRFGRPRAGTSLLGLAQGAQSTQLGGPAHSVARHALHIPPDTRFGRPLLRRNTLC